MNQFEMATKLKLRFPYKGLISVEDLWDLSMEQLDIVYKALRKDIKQAQEDSLLNEDKSIDEILTTKLFIVQYIFNQKKAELKRRELEVENAKKRQRLMEILANKQDEALFNKSEEELLSMLAELE